MVHVWMDYIVACGQVVCAKCSPHNVVMPRCFNFGMKAQRVCYKCETTVRDYSYRPEFWMAQSELNNLPEQLEEVVPGPRRRVIGFTKDPSKYDDAKSILTRAFHDDPVLLYLFPEPERRNELMRRFFGMWLSIAERYTTDDDSINMMYDSSQSNERDGARHIKGVAVWFPPGTQPSAWQCFVGGMNSALIAFGFSTSWRLLSLAPLSDLHDHYVRYGSGTRSLAPFCNENSHMYICASARRPAALLPGTHWSDSRGTRNGLRRRADALHAQEG